MFTEEQAALIASAEAILKARKDGEAMQPEHMQTVLNAIAMLREVTAGEWIGMRFKFNHPETVHSDAYIRMTQGIIGKFITEEWNTE